MKKYLLVCLLILFMLAVAIPAYLFSQEKVEDKESVWKQLEKMEMLKILKIKEIQKEEVWQVDLKNIKLALERVKINQKLTFLFHHNFCGCSDLGSYSPSTLNSWASIPDVIKIYKSKVKSFSKFGFRMETKIDLTNKAALLFIDATGLVKAVVMLAIPVTGW